MHRSGSANVVPEDRRASARLLRLADRWRWWLFALLALFHLAGFNGQWRFTDDSCHYLIIGRNVAEDHGYTHPEGRQRFVMPGLPVLIAGTFRIFGTDSVLPSLVILRVAGLLVLVATFRLFRLVGGRGLAVVMTCLLGVNAMFYELGVRLLTEIPFLLGAMLALVGWERVHRGAGRLPWSVALIGAGFAVMAAFRTVAMVFVAAFAAAVALELLRRRRYALLAGAAVAMAAAVAALRWGDPNLAHPFQLTADERLLLTRLGAGVGDVLGTIGANAAHLLGEVASEAMFAVDLGVAAWPFSAAVLLCAVGLARVRLLWFLLVAAFVCQWLLFIVTNRYVISVLPLLIYAWWRGALWLEHRAPPRWRSWIIFLMVALLFVPNAIRAGDVMLEQRTRPFIATYKGGRYEGPQRLARWIDENLDPRAVILAPSNYAPHLLYLSRRRTVDRLAEAPPDAPLYAAGPADRPPEALLDGHGAVAHAPIVTVETEGPGPAWSLRPVIRGGEGDGG